MKIFQDLYNALNTDKKGFSLRKLMAVAAVSTGIVVTVKNTNTVNLDSIIITWLLFASICQGMVTFGDLVSLRTGKSISVETTSTTINQQIKNEAPTA